MTNPFQAAPSPAPVISDTTAQQFGAPPVQQAAPNAFAPQAQGYDQAAALAAQGQHPIQAYAQPDPNAGIPMGMPGQPWSPQQHQAYGQTQGQPGYAPVPQQAQPVSQPPAAYQQPQQFAQQQAPQAAAPVAYAPPVAQQQAVPQFATNVPQAGVPAFTQPGTQQVGIDAFSAPSSGGGGRKPGWRDLLGRYVLIRVLNRGVMRDTYDKKSQEPTLDVNLVVLDGGQIIMSPKMGDPTSVAEVFSQATPCLIEGMIVTSKGMQNRLKADFVRGRVVREPINDLGKMLKDAPGSEPTWLKLEHWLAQDPSRVHDFKQSIMWSLVEDTSDEATQMTASYLQTPEGQAFCR